MKTTREYLKVYMRQRPLFLSVLRAKEASLYQQFLPFRRPVLDVGCGDGFFAHTAFGKRKIDVGLDTKDSRIGETEKNAAYKKTEMYDGYTFPFRNRMFATVVVNSVLEHVEDLPKMLSEIRRVLVPGGTCFATVMAQPWEHHLLGAVVFGDLYRTWMRKKQVHVNLPDHAGWRHAFVRAGLAPVEMIPYLTPCAARLLDGLHYVSAPSLISYAINGTWVWFPDLTRFYPVRRLADSMDRPVEADRAGALFWVLRRK